MTRWRKEYGKTYKSGAEPRPYRNICIAPVGGALLRPREEIGLPQTQSPPFAQGSIFKHVQPTVWLEKLSGTQPFGSINLGDCMYFPRLYELREDHDLTQKKIAEYLTMHPEVYRRYEAGIREIPVWAVIRLAELYHVSTDYLLGLTDEKNGHA